MATDHEARIDLIERTKHNLEHHPPKDARLAEVFQHIRSTFIEAAEEIILVCPGSRELSMSLTAIEDASMYAIAAVARYQDEAITQNFGD